MITNRHYTIMATALALAAPLFVVALVNLLILGGSALPDDLPDVPPVSDQPADFLVSLSENMLTMSIGLAAAAIWLFRQPVKAEALRSGRMLFLIGMLAALASIYLGLRFRFDLAKQLMAVTLTFEPLQDRIFWQGGMLLLQVSLTCASAVLHHLQRDKRYRSEPQ